MTFFIGRERARARGRLFVWTSIPFIYGMIIPVVALDFSTQIYQYICFPIYGIETVDRRRYVYCSPRGRGAINLLDRFHCWYCAYVNGALGFIRAVAAETEKYWCPIRHVPKAGFEEPSYHRTFAPSNDTQKIKDKILSYPYKK